MLFKVFMRTGLLGVCIGLNSHLLFAESGMPVFPEYFDVKSRPTFQIQSTDGDKKSTFLSFTGMLDMYYAYNSNNRKPTTLPSQDNPGLPDGVVGLRNFDIYNNSIILNYLELSVQRKNTQVGFRFDLVFGESVDLVLSPFMGSDEVYKHVGQAFVTYSPEKLPNLTFKVGKMYTHVGYEVFRSIYNWQYSRANIYALALPDWHFGAGVEYYLIPEKLSMSAYVYNGWNISYDSNAAKTLGFEATYTLNREFVVTYDLLSGPEQANDNIDRTTVHEVYAVWMINPEWAGAIAILYGEASNEVATDLSGFSYIAPSAKWYGATVSIKYSPIPEYYISPRFEYYRDAQGVTTDSGPNGTILGGVTLTNSYRFGQGLEGRLEFRVDTSTVPVFAKEDGSLNSNQATGTLALLYQY